MASAYSGRLASSPSHELKSLARVHLASLPMRLRLLQSQERMIDFTSGMVELTRFVQRTSVNLVPHASPSLVRLMQVDTHLVGEAILHKSGQCQRNSLSSCFLSVHLLANPEAVKKEPSLDTELSQEPSAKVSFDPWVGFHSLRC